MSMSISSVSSGSSGAVDTSKMASKMAAKMMSDLDPDNTGKVTKDQFVAGMTAKGVSSDDAAKMYDSIDTKKTGSIGKSDIEVAIKNGNLKPPSGGPSNAGGAGGAGGPGGSGKSGGAGAAGGASSASSSSTTYAKADTNEDGVVSAQEAAVYAIKHPSASSTESNNTDPSKLGQNVDKLV